MPARHIYLSAVATAIFAAAPAMAQVAQHLPAPLPGRPVPPARPVPPIQELPPAGPGHSWDQSHNLPRYFAGTVRCESGNRRTTNCRARTQNRVEIVQVHSGSCQRHQNFHYDMNSITVSGGCSATFAYGYGNVRPKAVNQSGGGSSALPWVLAGAGATAGIIAIANSSSNSPPPQQARPAPPLPPPPAEAAPTPAPPPVAPPPVPTPAPPASPVPPTAPFPALPPATIEANTGMLTPDQQRSMQTCLFEAARQTGVSGGSHLRLDSIDEIVQGNGGWRFRFRATGTWPNGQHQYAALCRATPTQIVEFTVS